ncbi:hypothetical protein [Bacillus sp. 1P06AnD]|uniref:YkvI family membrane protein n=1 Tax=Bacillus sp. 1P06AnD TaxID=3132208 RepID=UPI0039A3C16C
MQARITGTLQIAAVYVGTVVGAGFATGKEIVEFFTQYGVYGLFGIIIAGIIFIRMGTKMMLVSLSIKAKSYKELNTYLFGVRWGTFVNTLFFIMLFGVSAVMLSGAGAVFEEHLHIEKAWGILITSVLAFAILLQGMKGLFAVNILVVPMMIVFSFLLLFNGMGQPHFIEDMLSPPKSGLSFKGIISPFLYSAFNLALAQAVLVPVAMEVRDEKIIKSGGVVGGIALSAILMAGHLSLGTLDNVYEYSIPSAELMRNSISALYFLFLIVIYGEIFTSLVGNIFGLERQMKVTIKVNSSILFAIILLAAFCIGQFEYGALLSFLYPLFGYVSLVFLFLLYRSKKLE